jgi:hypothetical protein
MSTSRPFAYNPTQIQISGTTQVGDLSIGYPDVSWSSDVGGLRWWEGPDEDLGYVICHTTPAGNQPNPVNIPAYLGFWRSGQKTEQSFIDISNWVSTGVPTFTSGNEASLWLTTNGYWNSYPSTPTESYFLLTQSGLVLTTQGGSSLEYQH